MTINALATEVEQFIKSSSYQFGDRTGFSVKLTPVLTLPGRCDPGAYLDLLGLDKLPERVMVICGGNGGLAVECFSRGAKQVVVLESRTRFNKGIQGVKRLLDTYWRLENIQDCVLEWQPNWPRMGRDGGHQNYDLILWPEGVDEITTPRATFQAVADCLAPGGRLIVELAHGTHQYVEKINSWRPTGHAVNDMAEDVFGERPTTKIGGRGATMQIYTLTLPRDAKADAAEAAQKLKAETERAAAQAAAEAELKRARAEAQAKLAKAMASAAQAAEAVSEPPVESGPVEEPIVILEDEGPVVEPEITPPAPLVAPKPPKVAKKKKWRSKKSKPKDTE